MNRTYRLLIVASFTLNTRLFAGDVNQWKIQVTGLDIIAPPAEINEHSHGAFYKAPGVTVESIITPATGRIVSIDSFKSKLTSFVDDKGTDLLARNANDRFDNQYNRPSFSITDNKESCVTLDIHASGLPAKGAAALNISGKLSAKVAAGTKQFTMENVDIKTNTSFTCGDLPLKITATGFSQNEFIVTFSSAQDWEGIPTLEFFDAQGGKIEARKSAWGGGMGTFSVSYAFKTSLGHAKIVATCWQDLKTVEVPISIKTGLGL